jgi:hypothetical protein
MNDLPSVAQDMPTILKNGRALWLILEAAELRGLPMPFVARFYGVDDRVTLQFWTYDEVVTWAEVLGAEVNNSSAVGEWLEVRVEVVTTDGRAES